MTQSFDVMYV